MTGFASKRALAGSREECNSMIVTERKSKYKHKVIFEPRWANSEHAEIREWCERVFGPGGRSKKLRWRFGWTNTSSTYYFKQPKDATMFVLRWGGERA